ncbi:MAG: hypothetical protein JNM09_21585, partial [Blastocatellia bacterium]|nr:hypothetical protein [Blastocatellia bacterium]
MKTLHSFTTLLFCFFLTVALAFAQSQEYLRFTSSKPVQMMQLQVFNQTGEQVYDSGPMTVAEINWPLQAASCEMLKSGLYAYALTMQEAGVTRTRLGHFIVDRAQDRDLKTDKLWVTSQNDSGIGTELTVARNEAGTVAGTSMPSDRASSTGGDTTQSNATGSSETTTATKTPASPKTPKAKTEEADDTGSRLEAVYPYTQIRFGNSYADNGGYLISTLPSQAILSGGGYWNGASWVARDRATSMTAHQNGVIQFFTNGNLASGAAFGPLERMRVDLNGNVGIGIQSPLVKLHVAGAGVQEASVQSTTERAIFSLNSTIGGANRVWTVENGVNGKAGTFAVYDRTAGKERLTIDMEGNIKQAPETNGLVKAMAYINGDSRILRCYNSTLTGSAATTGNCGIEVTRVPDDPFVDGNGGRWWLKFGFDTSTRFISVTAVANVFGKNAGANYTTLGGSFLVHTFFTDEIEKKADFPFMVII